MNCLQQELYDYFIRRMMQEDKCAEDLMDEYLDDLEVVREELGINWNLRDMVA